MSKVKIKTLEDFAGLKKGTVKRIQRNDAIKLRKQNLVEIVEEDPKGKDLGNDKKDEKKN